MQIAFMTVFILKHAGVKRNEKRKKKQKIRLFENSIKQMKFVLCAMRGKFY